MKSQAVPQDNVTTHTEIRKAIYATGADGEYEIVPSTGWVVEEVATRQAVVEFERLALVAYQQAQAGVVAPLKFHMYNQRMDIDVLAQSTGIRKWRLKRHLKPKVFSKLSLEIVTLYAEALGLQVEELYRLPEARV